MCGIVARAGFGDAIDELLAGLQNLEYRGYDSAGVAVRDESGGISVCKREGETDALEAALEDRRLGGAVGIGHTRWSTHGAPSDANAHPHTDDTNRVAIVHNGIIRNHDALRSELRDAGHEFTSETDTEVIPHLVAAALEDGAGPEAAFHEATERLAGSYAIAMVVDGEDTIYATRNGSPLVLGIGENANYLASDVPAFLEFTDRVVYLEDDDVVALDADGYQITDQDGTPVDRTVETVEWSAGDARKGVYSHFMRKEIDEQPVSLRQTVDGRIEDGRSVLEEFPPEYLDDVSDVVFVACGTSYHAAMYGSTLLRRRGIQATALRANEFAHDPMPVTDRTLVVAVTQSGETADTLASLRAAKESPARTLAVTNVVGSSAAREADDALFIRAGPEIGVAATKTFSSQVAALALLADHLETGRTAQSEDREMWPDTTEATADGGVEGTQIDELGTLPDAVETVVSDGSAARLATQYAEAESYFFIGRGVGYPVALEGALKFKEITYEHAEGFAAGELKHGPLALVTPATVVVAVLTGRNDERTLHNIREAQSRGAPVIGVGPASATEVRQTVDDYLEFPDVNPNLAGVLANVHLQLLAYHAAEIRDRAIDKPRNLAKSVTVE
ncbi:glutamine--fructose-6-phosphate transaminase (isomerizing) [Halobellus sp. H-GB7]|uniref:glutamine--fructose-6-phosphate transaminase (isomerizing) n=1 Tax=Halobellus sp. H-GB7 TaxID=3069756 RepID=UPI0027B3F857|nr:glutamine--fructose-6-phosphate transaminase (isomerizing) [Halobellus sp. H-GB7]MDQ2054436.1 glutamine--fructose-6-phosphate transaminase (isomerizing) [Halobellus sp. H-GB7]